MLIVSHGCECRVWEPRHRFGYQSSPPFVIVSEPWQWLPAALESQTGITVDVEQQVCYPSPVEIPHNNKLIATASSAFDTEYALAVSRDAVDASYPEVVWSFDTGFTMGVNVLPVWGSETKPIEIEIVGSEFAESDTGEIAMIHDLDTACYRFTAKVRRQPRRRLAAGAAGGETSSLNDRLEFSIAVKIGIDWYRVRRIEADHYLEELPDGETEWRMLDRAPAPTPITTDLETGARIDDPLSVEFRLSAGFLTARVGGGATPLSVEIAGTNLMSKARFWAKKVLSAEIYGRPCYYPTSASLKAPLQDVAFSSAAMPTKQAVVRGVNPSTLAIPDSSELLGPRVSYTLNWTSPTAITYRSRTYAKSVSAVHSILLSYPGVAATDSGPYANVGAFQTVVSHVFDMATLQIQSSAVVTVPAYRHELLPDGSTGHWGDWLLSNGQRAIEIWASRTNPDGSDGEPKLRFTGYFGTRRVALQNGPTGTWQISCSGREVQAQSPVYNIPPIRGWNVFFAARHFANLAGFTDDDIGFIASVPVSPFDASLDEDGNPSLNLGTNGIASERLSGQAPWALLSKLASQIGYMLFVDVEGILQFRKFKIQPGIKKIFFESDKESTAQPGGGLEGCWSVTVEEDMASVASGLTTVGAERWSRQWIINRRTDPAVVNDPSAFNHLGYASDAVWIDPIFNDPNFASDSADRAMAVLRLPSLMVRLTTWLQPDIFPLDSILVYSPKLGVGYTPLLVTGITEIYPPGGAGSATITAAYVPDIE